jgi:hypothetical protein
MFNVEDNVFSHKNAINKNTWKKSSYLPKVGCKSRDLQNMQTGEDVSKSERLPAIDRIKVYALA